MYGYGSEGSGSEVHESDMTDCYKSDDFASDMTLHVT